MLRLKTKEVPMYITLVLLNYNKDLIKNHH